AIGIDTKKGMNAEWGDYDNDGLLDVYVTNITDEYMKEGNFLWRNNGNLTFSDVSRETGTADTGWGWGAKFFDYDNDGWLDLFVTNPNGEPFLYHNVVPAGAHWAEFALAGTKSNRAGIGAQLRATAAGRTYLRFIDGGNGFAGQSTTRVHFGLGSAPIIDSL